MPVQSIYPYPGATNPDVYEWENRISDPDNLIEVFMQSMIAFDGAIMVDVGSGSAYHAWQYAESAAHVYAVEPAPEMLRQAFNRQAGQPRTNLSLIAAGAEDIPLRDGLADIIHSRFAYFFGPETGNVRSCEPGLREARRLLKSGGVFFVIDNNLVTGDFARFLAHMYEDPDESERRQLTFWHEQGFVTTTVESEWRAPDRDVLRRVIEMEFKAERVDAIIGAISGTTFSYHYNVHVYVKE